MEEAQTQDKHLYRRTNDGLKITEDIIADENSTKTKLSRHTQAIFDNNFLSSSTLSVPNAEGQWVFSFIYKLVGNSVAYEAFTSPRQRSVSLRSLPTEPTLAQ